MARAPSSTQDEILKQLRTLNRLVAAQLKHQVGQMEVVELLAGWNLTAKEIGDVLGTSPATVAVTVQRLRHKQRKKTRRPDGEEARTS